MPNQWRPVLAEGLTFRVRDLSAQLLPDGKGGQYLAPHVITIGNSGSGTFGPYAYTGSYSVENMGRTGNPGSPGPSGPSGDQGASGTIGGQGTKGNQGFIGKQGATGATGIQGSSEADGATGATGATGIQGATGATGFNGLSGATGLVGQQGKQGATGFFGPTGDDGATGATGPQGATGATGATGVPGTQGSSEADGATGATGATGFQGATGATGFNGLSGATGLVGQQGAQGKQGFPGPTGDDGATGATGPQGATGATGATGVPGTQGSSEAPGATGATGATGLTGLTGSPGDQGKQGATGATGATGFQGATGATGIVGNQGIQGLQGGVGSQGNQGPSGPSGPPGPQGTQGGQGQQGATGTINSPLDADIRLYTPAGPAGGGDRYLKMGLNRNVLGGKSAIEMFSDSSEGVRIVSDSNSKNGAITNTIEHDGSGDLKVSFTGSLSVSSSSYRKFDGTISGLPIFSSDIAGNWSNTSALFSGTGDATISDGAGYICMYHPITSAELPSNIQSTDPITLIRNRNLFKVDSGDSVNVAVYTFVRMKDTSRGWVAVGAKIFTVTGTSYATYAAETYFPSTQVNPSVNLTAGDFDQIASVIYVYGITTGETLYVRGQSSYPTFNITGYLDNAADDKLVIQRQTFSFPQFDVSKGGNVRMHNIKYENTFYSLKFDIDTKKVSFMSSTRKTKKDIKPLDQSLIEGFSKLQPVTYIQTNDLNQNILGGFIAEEAAEAHPLFAGWGPNYKTSEDGTLLINEDPIDDQIVPTSVQTETLLATAIAKTQQLDQKVNQELQNLLETDGLA